MIPGVDLRQVVPRVVIHNDATATGTISVMRRDGPTVLLQPGDAVELWLGRDGGFYRLTRWRRLLLWLGVRRWLP